MGKSSAGALGLLLAVGLACGGSGTVAGERVGLLGDCPEGEVCAQTVPGGLVFQGQVLYDDMAERLGPVLVGGKFDLSFFPVAGVMVPFEVEADGETITPENAELGLPSSSVELWGTAPGVSYVRVVHAQTGELLDRLAIETVQIEGVELTNVNEPERTELIAGCEEMVGVQLVADGGRLRAFDQSVEVHAPGQISPDPGVWDCFRYVVPVGVNKVDFEVVAGGEVWVHTFEVVPQSWERPCPTAQGD